METLKPGKGHFLRVIIEGASMPAVQQGFLYRGMQPIRILELKAGRILVVFPATADDIDSFLEKIASSIPPGAEIVETAFTGTAELEGQVLDISGMLKINLLGERDNSSMSHGDNSLAIRGDLAFGSGLHPTTRMCLDLLVKAHELTPVMERVLDLGAGTGILALSAIKLGASHVLAVDTDFCACQECQENIARNRSGSQVMTVCGSIACVKGIFDLVVANIVSSVLYELAADLADITRQGGLVILSGFFPCNKENILDRLGSGMPLAAFERDGWQSLLWHKA